MVNKTRYWHELKLPDSPDNFQCPAHDEILKRIFQFLEVCSFATTGARGCSTCKYFTECRDRYDGYAKKGEDKLLLPIDLVTFVEEFGAMRLQQGRLL